MILFAADQLAVSSLEAVAVVRDKVNDLLAGTSAGAGIVVGVLSGAHTRDWFTQVPHTHLIDNIAGLPAVLMERHQPRG